MNKLQGLLRICFFNLLLILSFGFFLQGCSLKSVGPEVLDEGVRFSIKAPQAKKVSIIGSFNRWSTEADALSGPDSDGVWTITMPLKDGRYEYLFFVDGKQWVLDPEVPFVDDGFGGRNSVVSIKR